MLKPYPAMKGEAASGLRWRGSLGIIVTLLSTVGFVLVLAQAARLNSEPGLDAASAVRERLAVSMTAGIVDTMQSVYAYQQALALQDDPERVPALRTAADAKITALIRDFREGDASSISPAGVDRVTRAWKNAARAKAGPASVAAVRKVVVSLEEINSGMEDASNLTYDPSSTSQNLADIRVIELPIAMAAIARVQTLADLAIEHHALTLSQRVAAANGVSSLRGTTDLSAQDDVQMVAQRLTKLLPERAASFAALPGMAETLYRQASAYADDVSNTILLLPQPAAKRAQIDASSAALMLTTFKTFDAFGDALDASLARRAEIAQQRNRDYYLALIFAALAVVGGMIAIAQLVAARDRRQLREAQQESARLAAELARQHAEEALRLSEAQFKAVFDGAAVGIAVVDRRGQLVDANGVFRAAFGDEIERAIDGHHAEFSEVLEGARETFEFEQHLLSAEGDEIWADVTVSTVNGPDSSAPMFAICMFRDKTELKHSERRMKHDQLHDALTGLPNRRLFEEHLHRRLQEASSLLDSFFAVLFVDLEHFKDVNESMGHTAGDVVLTQVAQRINGAVDANDFVARLGGDEFAILIQSLGDVLHVESVARRVLNGLTKPIAVDGRSVYLGANVGIAIGSSSYERSEDIMRDAEIAMQHAKTSGAMRYALFDSQMHDRAQKRIELTTDLRLAIERSEFRMLYQPIVSIHDGHPIGCEALIRWDHPMEGVLNPSEFIPLAEQTGLAAPIGRFVLKTAAEQLAAWRRAHGADFNFTMNVNISAAEVVDPDFERYLIAVVERNGLSPSDFTLEITENVVLDAGSRANVTLERLRERGFRLCIDDFGTGYSSMRYLQQFKVDSIKIDRSFVGGANGELASEPIVRTLMTLAEAFDVRVVAEGVETARQRDVLRNAGCRLVQGFLFARPLSGAEMVATYPEVFGRTQRVASA